MTLELQKQELQRQVEAVQQLRRALHDASIVEKNVSQGSAKNVNKPPQVMRTRRTVDAPTLNVLKSPNYPFTLCEEAPPAYLPPPVPYDVEGEIESLKQRVLQVQEDLQIYQKKHSRGGAPLTAVQVLDFFGQSNTYAEIAWEVSSLQGLYRWVLSHSISHLWNCKEQLEYVLTEHGQELPKTVEEMDASLEEYPFIVAVSILDSDRQEVVAQERSRLRSVSRTFRDKVPALAVTAATSCYLTAEEKYMYQEFYNQSEHMLLLLSHAAMINKANGASSSEQKAQQSVVASGQLSHFQKNAHGALQETGAKLLPNVAVIGEMDIDTLATETFYAVSAEREVITTLMKAIRERQERGECFEVSPAERERRRAALISVYGCVLSDMSLMAHQMNLTVEFMEYYEAWLKLHGYDSHDAFMKALSTRSAGTPWPTMEVYGDLGSGDGHSHFVPPTESMMRYHRPPERKASQAFDAEEKSTLSEYGKSASAGKASPADISGSGASALRRSSFSGAPTKIAAGGAVDAHTVVSPLSASPGMRKGSSSEVAGAFYALLIEAAEAMHDTVAMDGDDNSAIERLWLTACVRYAVLKMLRHEWRAADVARNMSATEDALLALIGREVTLSHMKSTAAALCVVLQELTRLTLARSPLRSLVSDVPVTVHIPDNVDHYARAVADVTNVVEQQRWSSVLDALWFQGDPSAAASGGLLFPSATSRGDVEGPVPSNKESRVHFLYIECIEMPSRAVSSDTTTITICYRLPRMSPAAKESRRGAPTLTSVSDAQPSSKNGRSRYQLARQVLLALYEVEAKGLLPCFACRVSEVTAVPLGQMLYIFFDDGENGTVVDEKHLLHLCILPPPAMELRRVHAIAGQSPAPTRVMDELYSTFGGPVSLSSIGLILGALLESMAARAPLLHDLYMAASTVREKAMSDIKSGLLPREFENGNTRPSPVSCSPAKVRALSIQRESVINRNSHSKRSFISPLLRHVEDRISLLEAGEGRTSSNTSSNKEPHQQVKNTSTHPTATVLATPGTAESQLPSVTSRQTQMIGGAGRTSSSPSAVRPERR